MMKEIYRGYEKSSEVVPPHAMARVNVIWVMPYSKEAETFMDCINECLEVSKKRLDLPELVIVAWFTWRWWR